MSYKFADLHQDTINIFKKTTISKLDKIPFDTDVNDFQINIPYLKNSNTKLVFSTSFAYYQSKNTIWQWLFDNILYTLFLNKEIVKKYNIYQEILDVKDLEDIEKSDKIWLVNHLEWIYGVNDLRQIDLLYELWIRSMGLLWNEQSNIWTSCKTKDKFWLTEFGKKVVKHIEKKNIIIDLAHISNQGFVDVCEIYEKPLLVSHTASRSMNNCDRNISDNQLRLIAKNQGLLWVNFSTLFLNWGFEWTIQDVISHIKYFIDFVWIDNVWIGTDFEWIWKNISPSNLKSINDIPNLALALEQNWFTKEEIHKILFQNAYNFVYNSLKK